MKEINAILINSEKKEITAVKIPVDEGHSNFWDTIYKLCNYDCGAPVYIRDENVIMVDDEGLLKNPKFGFVVEDYPDPLAGNGIIIGPEVEEQTQDCTLSVDKVKSIIKFIEFQGEDNE